MVEHISVTYKKMTLNQLKEEYDNLPEVYFLEDAYIKALETRVEVLKESLIRNFAEANSRVTIKPTYRKDY